MVREKEEEARISPEIKPQMEITAWKDTKYQVPRDENKIVYPLEQSITGGRQSSSGGEIIAMTQVRLNEALI